MPDNQKPTIKLAVEVKDRLAKFALHKDESYESIVVRFMDHYELHEKTTPREHYPREWPEKPFRRRK